MCVHILHVAEQDSKEKATASVLQMMCQSSNQDDMQLYSGAS